MTLSRRAVILANLGGPTHKDEVRPFLKNLFSDPDIFRFPFGTLGQKFFPELVVALRVRKSKKYYAAIGGGSPLHKNTLSQAAKLQDLLEPYGDFTVLTAQRYWHPLLSEVAKTIGEDRFSQIILLPLYPQYSTTTTLSIINEWKRVASNQPEPTIIERFYQEKGYIEACTRQIEAKRKNFSTPPHILFSAHSIPEKLAIGDPYQKELIDNMELIMNVPGRNESYSLCFQSKVGPIRWLKPTVEEEIDTLLSNGIRHLLVFPISFVSEHVETLYELDIQKRAYALSKGIEQFERADTVQDCAEFIQVLKTLVVKASQ